MDRPQLTHAATPRWLAVGGTMALAFALTACGHHDAATSGAVTSNAGTQTTVTQPVPTPGASASASASAQPSGTAIPGTSTPDPLASANASATPDATASPEVSATPDATASPEASATPDATASPEVSASPDATASPQASASPVATTPSAPLNAAQSAAPKDSSVHVGTDGNVTVICDAAHGNLVYVYHSTAHATMNILPGGCKSTPL